MVDTTTKWKYTCCDMKSEEILRHLSEMRRERDRLTDELTAIASIIDNFEKLLTATEREDQPTISLRAAILQVLRESKGEPLHVKDVLQQVEALGAHVRSANNDKVSRVDVGIYGLKRQGLPVERVGVRTWKYFGGDAINFKTERARKKRQRRNDTVAKELDKDSVTGGEARG